MKNRNLAHSDNWRTPPELYNKLNAEFNFDFDPCPLNEGEIAVEDDGLIIEWGERNFVNPGYSLKVKTDFVKKALTESKKRKLCVLLIPVSTSTKLFHDSIKPNATEIRFIEGRVPFIGINRNKKQKDGSYCDEYVNWHLIDEKAPGGVKHVRAMGMHDSMIVIFDGR